MEVNSQDIISQVTKGAQQNHEKHSADAGGLTDLIKGFLHNELMSGFCKNSISQCKRFTIFVGWQVLFSFWRPIQYIGLIYA